MKAKLINGVTIFLFVFLANSAVAQDTYSIVAVDPETGEVGSAGASCVDLNQFFPNSPDDFIAVLHPGIGAINTQAAYNATNQNLASDRALQGDSAGQIIDYLLANDVESNSRIRQYGIALLNNGSPDIAAHTGLNCFDEKYHITGETYSIQGNILIDSNVLDSMEAAFLRTEGPLSCKLMAALQGANRIGADSRCASNNTSSLFGYLKVARPDDVFGDPSFLISVRTSNGDQIEPIDSLQILFNAQDGCDTTEDNPSSIDVVQENWFTFSYQNDFHKLSFNGPEGTYFQVFHNAGGSGLRMNLFPGFNELDISDYPTGIYYVVATHEDKTWTTKFLKR